MRSARRKHLKVSTNWLLPVAKDDDEPFTSSPVLCQATTINTIVLQWNYLSYHDTQVFSKLDGDFYANTPHRQHSVREKGPDGQQYIHDGLRHESVSNTILRVPMSLQQGL
jgi:hypothetical protein